MGGWVDRNCGLGGGTFWSGGTDSFGGERERGGEGEGGEGEGGRGLTISHFFFPFRSTWIQSEFTVRDERPDVV